MWLIDKYHKRIRGWSLKWLSKGGILVLVQAVLQQYNVYWPHLYVIPQKILVGLRQIMEISIWRRGREDGKFHLTIWDLIAMLKENGGWGILDLDTFGKALLIKSIWRGLQIQVIWHDIIRHKYLNQSGMEELYI